MKAVTHRKGHWSCSGAISRMLVFLPLILGACAHDNIGTSPKPAKVHPPVDLEARGIDNIQQAPELMHPAPDATVLIFEYSTEPCMFRLERDGLLLGTRFAWNVQRDRIPLHVQGTAPLRSEPSIPVNQYQLCLLYGTQQCEENLIQLRLRADSLVWDENLGPRPQPFDPNVPAKAWRLFPLTAPPYLRRADGPPIQYEFFPGASTSDGGVYFPAALAKPDPITRTHPQLQWQVRACGTNPLTGGGLHCYSSKKRPVKLECQFQR